MAGWLAGLGLISLHRRREALWTRAQGLREESNRGLSGLLGISCKGLEMGALAAR